MERLAGAGSPWEGKERERPLRIGPFDWNFENGGILKMGSEEAACLRLARLEKALIEQRAFLTRVGDPDVRQRAEFNLLTLVDMRDDHALSMRPAAGV